MYTAMARRSIMQKTKRHYIGVNKAESSDLVIFMTNKKLEEIRFIKQPSAILYPLEKAPKEELFLKDFKWQVDARPLKKEDIFIWKEEPENQKTGNDRQTGKSEIGRLVY